MTFVLSLQLKADAKDAKKEIAATAAEAKKLGTETQDMGRKAQDAGADIVDFGNASQQAGAKTQGAAGAVRSITSAFLGSINPIGLITMASLAAGTAMLHWLTGSGKEAPKLEEAIASLSSTLAEYRTIVSDRSFDSMAKNFGAVTPEVIALQQQLQNLKLRQIVLDAEATGAALSKAFNFDSFLWSGQLELSNLFKLNVGQLGSLETKFREIGAASNIQDQLTAVTALKTSLLDITKGTESLTSEQAAFLAKVLESEEALTRAQNVSKLIAMEEQARVAGAQAMLDSLQQENAMRELILINGAGSVQVTQARAQAEEAAREAAWDAKGATEEMKIELRAAFEEAQKLSRLEMASGIAGATAEARLLAATLGVSLDTAIAIRNLGGGAPKAKYSFGLQGVSDPIIGGVNKLGFGANPGRNSSRDRNFNSYVPPVPKGVGSGAGRGGAGGGGVSEIDKQRKALDSLIEREERELALLRETDPVQKEMLRHREAMAGATEAERAKVEDLITSQIRLKQAMETMEWASEQAGGTLVDALMGAKGAGEQLIQTLKRAALEALILGKGPLTGLFGGGGGGGGLLGGLVGSIFGGGAPVKLATGGMVHGPGSGTSDEVPILASNGEFMMNAKATARYRHLLEAMNSGAPIPGFANGGAIGGGSRLASAPGGDTMQVAIDLRGAQGDKSIEEKAFKAMKAALDEWDRKVFPRRMQALRSDPRRIG